MNQLADDDQLTILVIDDEPEMSNMIAEALLKEGHQVITAASAEEGFEQLPYHTFQVAFIDHHLPKMEGIVFGGYLRRNNPHMQIALVTGETDPKLRKESTKLGITFIQKPFGLNEIKDVVDRCLHLAAERREQRIRQSDPDFGPPFVRYHPDLPGYFSMPGVPDRIADHLARRIKECLNNISSAARYNERDRVAVLAGLLAAEVLGISLPKGRDGSTLFEYYDRIMSENGRRTEFTDFGSSKHCRERSAL